MPNLLKIKKKLILIVCAGAVLPLHAQLWRRECKSGFDRFVNGLWTNIENGKMYITGNFPHADTLTCHGVCLWDGINLSKMNPLPPPKACELCGTGRLLKFDNRYFSTGEYLMGGLIESDGINWRPSATFPVGYGPTSISLINNKLILLGWFDSINDIPAKCIAEYNTQSKEWQRFAENEPFNPRDKNLSEFVTSNAFYKNEYYFGGNIDRQDDFKEILRYDGTNWKPLNKGIFGGLADARGMIVYKGLLYVWGGFLYKDGNVDDHVMAWDGEKWLDPFPHVQYLYDVQTMSIINDQLYISGMFVFPQDDDSLAYTIARWDGCDFSAFGIQLKYPEADVGPAAIQGFQNRIYVSLQDTFQGKYTGYLVSFDENLPPFRTLHINDCPAPPDTVFNIQLFPNPFSNKLTLKATKVIPETELSIFDMLGRLVYFNEFKLSYQYEFELPQLSSGVYYAIIKANGDFVIRNKVIKN